MSKFNENDFEHKLFKLKDSHDSIASLSNWCLSHVEHHGKIVATWLGALKKVKMDHRVLLFYLANDIIQYSKKKGLAFVSTFAPALQKATTMVRDPNIKNKILRIFKIWDERNVYDETFLVDLSSLLTRDPKAANRIDLEDFQPTLLYSRLKSCQTLEEDTDAKMKLLVDNKMPLTDTDRLRTTLKNRKASEDVISEIDEGIKKIGAFISALEAEIKERSGLIDLLDISEQYYEKELGEAKIVSNAYKCFTNRVKTVKKKLDEKIETLPSPVPTPSPTAPSPEPDAGDSAELSEFTPGPGGSFMDGSLFSNQSVAEEFDNFYGRPRTDVYSPGSAYNGDSLEKPKVEIQPPVQVQPPVVPVNVPPVNVPPVFNYFRPITDTTPPPPPPRPPTEPILDHSVTSQFNATYNDSADISNCSSEGLKIEVITTPTKDQSLTSLLESMVADSNPSLPPPPVPPMEFGWENADYWESPESPPIYEKEGLPPPLADVGLALGTDVDMRSKDVDHRNLISLTGGVEQDWDFPPTVEVNENEDMEMSDDDVGNIEDVGDTLKSDSFPILPIKAELNNKIDKAVNDILKEPEFQPIKSLEAEKSLVSPENKKRVGGPYLTPPPVPLPTSGLLRPQVDEEKLWNPFPPPPVPPFEPQTPLGPKSFQDGPSNSGPGLNAAAGGGPQAQLPPPGGLLHLQGGPQAHLNVPPGTPPELHPPLGGPRAQLIPPPGGPPSHLNPPPGLPPAHLNPPAGGLSSRFNPPPGVPQSHLNPPPGGPQTHLNPPAGGPHPPQGGPQPAQHAPPGGQQVSQQSPGGPQNPLHTPPRGFEHPPPPPPPFPPNGPFNRFPPFQPPPRHPQEGLLPNPVPSFDSKPRLQNSGQPIPSFDASPTGSQPRPNFYGGYRPRFDQRQMGGQSYFRGSPYRTPGHQFRPMRPRYQRF